MILINVKYHGPTNYTGSRWIATMQHGVVDGRAVKLRASRGYDHADKDGHDGKLEACQRLIDKWDAKYFSEYPDRTWRFEFIGCDHRGEYIYTARWNPSI